MKTISILTVLAIFAVQPLAAVAEETVLANGRILAADGKTPVPDAAIAVYDEKGNVIAHGKTDVDGRYSMAVPRGALHLTKRRGSFFGGLLKGAGGLLNVAAGLAPMAMGGFGGIPGLAGGGLPLAAMSGLSGAGNPLSAASGLLAAQSALSTFKGAHGGAPSPAAMEAMRRRASARRLSRDDNSEQDADVDLAFEFGSAPAANSPGAMIFRIASPGREEVGGVGQIYWIQDDTIDVGGKKRKQTTAWVDPVWLAKQGEGAPSRIVRGYFAFQAASVDPAIVETGQKVTISARLPLPEEPKVQVVVVARNAKTGATWQLLPSEGAVYRAEIPVEDGFSKNDQTISVLAYAASGEEGRSKKAEDAIDRAGMWKLERPYEYNPKIVSSRNRLDLRLTVVPASTRQGK
jgi:hypothetical protein